MFEERMISPTEHPLEDIVWERRDLEIRDDNNQIVFKQDNVECPKDWSDLACTIAARLYFYGAQGSAEREDSIRDLIERIVNTIAGWGHDDSYFGEPGMEDFIADLSYILVNQIAAFNTPVWINIGTPNKPQASACFISSVDDHLNSITELHKTEIEIFRYGSGNGVNLSPLRGSKESLKGGGSAAGPLAFMRALDSSCAAMKSGGVARRGALMRILNIDHPDIVEFIHLKEKAEGMAHTLIEAGYDSDWETGVYKDIPWQNANNSVRVIDDFISAVKLNEDWELKSRVSSKPVAVYKAGDLWREICKAAWSSGCPGIQFHDTTNRWNTCKNDEEIQATNPCSEFAFLNDTACNLSSINLTKFSGEGHWFIAAKFENVIRVLITAMDILVDRAHYPTEKINKKTKAYRPLGLGFSNLGALLMRNGIPYNSDEGRQVAATITALMHGVACDQSANLAEKLGPFKRYGPNAECVRDVMSSHWKALDEIPIGHSFPSKFDQCSDLSLMENLAEKMLSSVIERPLRNAQLTLLAPCGTIGLLMDCDTTGIEPDIALVKTKQMVGGNVEKIVNQSIPTALKNLDYADSTIETIVNCIKMCDAITGSSSLHKVHLPVFETALDKDNSISWQGHLMMMASVQSFLSGAISKTINLPHHSSPEDVETVYMSAHEWGLKSVAIYRDGSKGSQPVTIDQVVKPLYKKLPDEAEGPRFRFKMGGTEVYAITSCFDDGTLGELFITIGKSGSDIRGLYDVIATLFSVALQHGVPLEVFVEKMKRQKMDPFGPVKLPGEEKATMFTSIIDCIFHWIEKKYLKHSIRVDEKERKGDEPFCVECGSLMVRSGNCFLCKSCASTSGCS